jgi:hypothetical protein
MDIVDSRYRKQIRGRC